VIAEKAADVLAGELTVPPTMYRSTARPWQLASPDRFVTIGGETGIIECKATSSWRADDWADGAPARVVLQIQHQHAVLGTVKGWAAVLIDGRDFRLVECDRDDATIEEMNKIESRFWEQVVNREPPPVDGSDDTTAALAALYATPVPDLETELVADALDWAASIRAINDQLGLLNDEKVRYQNLLRAAIGDAEAGTVNGQKIATWKLGKPKDEYTVRATGATRTLRLSKAPK
jgi:predicted phage-related endonuclease